MIQTEALIGKFQMALDDKWGYIWGTAGVEWTQAKQNQKVTYMADKYGADWKKNADAKDDTYYYAAVYGSKWIGHMVADCSGLFVWAFKQLGGSIYHGSNTMYKTYCSAKGKLTDAVRKTLKPGTAVFTGTENNHGHVGLYVGDGKVIEASGTQAGVCVSNLSAGKWTYWGELKDVAYSGENTPVSAPAPADEQTPAQDAPTLKRGSKGQKVKDLQTKLVSLGYSVGSYGIDGDFGKATEAAVKQFQRDHDLTPDGIVGPKTYAALETGKKPEGLYTVTVSGLTKAAAEALVKEYGGKMAAE